MKILIVGMALSIAVGSSFSASAQTEEAKQLLLNIEKLAQLKSILSNMYKGYQLVSKGLNTIKNVSEGNYKLHEAFLDGLLQVSPIIKKYKRIADIITCQQRIMKEYKKAFNYFKATGSFTMVEIDYMEKVYSNVSKQSLNNLDELLMVTTASKLRMSDDERLKAIDAIFSDVQDKLTFLGSFNNSTKALAVQRMKEQTEIDLSRKLNDIK